MIKTVMISSTVRDLPLHRAAVRDACLEQGFYPTMMEYLPASSSNAIAVSLQMVDEADMYVLILGKRYGTIPSDKSMSITEMEFDRALQREIDILVFLMAANHEEALSEQVEAPVHNHAVLLEAFKKRAASGRIVKYFTSHHDLRAHIIHSLSQIKIKDHDISNQKPPSTRRKRTPRKPAKPGDKIKSLIESPLMPGKPQDLASFQPPEQFIGRLANLAWMLERLQPTAIPGAIGVFGTEGIGKTALVAEAAQRLNETHAFPDGVAVVRCENISDPGIVLRQIATCFNPYRRQPSVLEYERQIQSIMTILKNKQALIILENVEATLPCDKIIYALSQSSIKLIITARKPLPAGYNIESLTLTPMIREDIEALFLQSAGYTEPLTLSIDERIAIKQVIHILGRHTLAVKLAGKLFATLKKDIFAFVDDLEADPEIVARVFNGEPGRPGRLVKMIYHESIEELSHDSRRLFLHLAAFASPEFGERAIHRLAEGLELQRAENSLQVLIDRAFLEESNIDVMSAIGDHRRLRMHPSLRTFAIDDFKRLPQSEKDASHRILAEFYGEYSNTVPESDLGYDDKNIMGALVWAQNQDEDELLAQICSGMQLFWRDRGRITEGLEYLPRGIRAAENVAYSDGKQSSLLRASRLAICYGQILMNTGKLDEAEHIFTETLDLRRKTNDKQGQVIALSHLGQIAWHRAQLKNATTLLNESIALRKELKDHQGIGIDTSYLGRIAWRRGQVDKAEQAFRLSLDIAREVNDLREEGINLSHLGQIARRQGRHDEAELHFHHSLKIVRAVQDQREEARVLFYLARIAQRTGRLEEVNQYFQQSLAIRKAIQDRQGEAMSLSYLGRIIEQKGQLDEAEGHFRASLALREAVQDKQGEGMDLSNLGQIAWRRGRLDEAEKLYRQSLSIARAIQDRRSEGVNLANLGRIIQRRGKLQRAVDDYFLPALKIVREVQDRQYEAVILNDLGQIAHIKGALNEADNYFQQSLTIRNQVQDRRGQGLDTSFLGQVAHARGDITQAEALYTKALEIDREVKAKRNEGIDLSDLGRVALRRGRLTEAEKLFTQSIAIRKEVQDRYGEGLDISNLGRIALRRGDLGKAMQQFLQSLYIRREVQDRQGEGAVLAHLGRVAQWRGLFDEALSYYTDALVIHKEVEDQRGYGVVLGHLGKLAQLQGKVFDAKDYFEKAQHINNQVQNRREQGVINLYLGQIAQLEGKLQEAESFYHLGLSIAESVGDVQVIADTLLTLGKFYLDFKNEQEKGCALLERAISFYRKIQ